VNFYRRHNETVAAMWHRYFLTAGPPASSEAEPAGVDLSDRPFIASVNLLSAALLEILRPFCWEALILLYLLALFTSR
jgi:hypothetical protein